MFAGGTDTKTTSKGSRPKHKSKPGTHDAHALQNSLSVAPVLEVPGLTGRSEETFPLLVCSEILSQSRIEPPPSALKPDVMEDIPPP